MGPSRDDHEHGPDAVNQFASAGQRREDEIAAEALAETPKQNYVGKRDLTTWRTSIGRRIAELWLRLSRRVAPHRLLAFTLALGLVVAGLMTALAAGIYDAVTESDGVAGLDRPVLNAAIRLRSPDLDAVATTFTYLGGPVALPLLATVAATVLSVSWRQLTPILLTAVTGLGSLALTVVGKSEVARARPPLVDAVPPFEHSFSFPSGHSLNSLALAGIIAYLLVRKQHTTAARSVTIAVATVFALLMGLSRVYLGHHWLTDVLVAWALGIAWLSVVITSHRLYLTRRRLDRARPSPAP